MPIYEYECSQCGVVTEAIHGMNETPTVECESCGGTKTSRIMSACSFREGVTNEFRQAHEQAKEVVRMRRDLKENYGVEKVQMANNTAGKTFRDIYSDVKSQGSGVAEAMEKTREQNKQRVREKHRDWTRKAMQRTTERGIEKRNRRLKKEQEKRAIQTPIKTK